MVRQTLQDLLLAIEGTIIMSTSLKDTLDAMYDARVPERWRRVSRLLCKIFHLLYIHRDYCRSFSIPMMNFEISAFEIDWMMTFNGISYLLRKRGIGGTVRPHVLGTRIGDHTELSQWSCHVWEH